MAKLSLIPGSGGFHRQFEALVRSNYDVLFRAAYRFTGSAQDAEDLVQETFTRAYRNIGKLVGFDNPRTWLLCVARRLFIDQTRRHDWRNVDSLEDAPAHSLSSREPGPDQTTESEMVSQRIESSWRKLGKEEASLLALHDIEGYSLSEVQEITGLKIGTIKSRLHRARVKLGRLLRAQGDFDHLEMVRRADQ
jgi:RNA polymerase sigma-70 factor (ECF subfamily)